MTLAPSLAKLSATLLELYRMAEQLAPEAYQGWALGVLQRTLRFNSAIWTTGHIDGGKWSIYRAHAVGLPPKALEHFRPSHPEDRLAPRASSFRKRWRLAHDHTYVTADPLTSLATSITLYRRSKADAFTAGERRFFDAVAAHLAENHGFAAIQQLLRSTRSDNPNVSSSAVVDRFAQLQIAPPDFQRLLRLEWPEWRDRRLPEELRACIRAGIGGRFVGDRVAISVSRMSDVFLLQAREKHPADELSERESAVARLLAQGHTYKEAAKQLGVAPSTIRNHIASIFAKLGVKKQSEMAAALGSVE